MLSEGVFQATQTSYHKREQQNRRCAVIRETRGRNKGQDRQLREALSIFPNSGSKRSKVRDKQRSTIVETPRPSNARMKLEEEKRQEKIVNGVKIVNARQCPACR